MAERLLVIAPHPDDEVLGAGGTMAKAAEAGDEVFVALLTSGDGFREDAARYYLSLDVTPAEYLHMGYERQHESRRALSTLGVPDTHIYFLGFPDGGLDALWLTHWTDPPWHSPTTERCAVPYLTAWREGKDYTGRTLVRLLMDLYREIRPTRLIMPSAYDTHPDHWGTNAFATLAWAELAREDRAWEQVTRWGYLVHWPLWPLPLAYRPAMAAEPPVGLRALGQEPWHQEWLGPRLARKKRDSLMVFESQVELIKPYMLAFCRQSEVFAVESHWLPLEDSEGMRVQNPEIDWLTRHLVRTNPLAQAVWARTAERDAVRISFHRPPREDTVIEVSVHPVDGTHRHFLWRLTRQGPLQGDLSVTWNAREVVVEWEPQWFRPARTVMAGVQWYDKEKCEGKLPFRVMSWRGWT
ncbi:MAG: PIG-L family deacetylase [Firmicutes bacterium]|nr:PIG-L family deacetylase [Bacillota bacterium]